MSSFTKPTRSPCSASSSAKIGSTALQGPHHGAQKSTTTGLPACRTSWSKLSSPTSCTRTTLQAACQPPEAQGRHLPDRLEHDPTTHLRATALAVDERDRHLDNPEAGAQRAVGHLDLEGVAAGGDRVEVDRLQHLAPEALEAAGQVADADAEQDARVERAARRDEPPHDAPVPNRPAGHVARAEHEVGLPRRLDQARHVGRVVREVAVDLDDQLRVAGQHPPETREVSGAEALLALAVEHLDVVELGGQPVGQLAGA